MLTMSSGLEYEDVNPDQDLDDKESETFNPDVDPNRRRPFTRGLSGHRPGPPAMTPVAEA